MRILLTGSTGQLGNALKSALQTTFEIILVPRDQMDFCKPELVRETIQRIRPDIIINPAAFTAVDLAEAEPGTARMINAVTPGVIADEAKNLARH